MLREDLGLNEAFADLLRKAGTTGCSRSTEPTETLRGIAQGKFIIVHPAKNVQSLPNRYFKYGLRGLVFGLGSVLRLLEVG
jgi:hypothetical protein